MKPGTPYGHVPFLTVNSVEIGECHAIERFLAREFGLMGSTSLEAALIDSAMEHYVDIFRVYLSAWEKNDAAEMDKLYAETLFKELKPYEKRLVTNGTGYLVGSELSLADLLVWFLLGDYLDKQRLNPIFAEYPQLQKLVDRVGAIPELKHHVNTRAITPW
eukprot:CAMPEP_0184660930 /NCGR_PEP_ID=MMETSP0308-20130426/36084_1 /TAXON_ID=38269 /ORGANISM="Gloeochaete witrockiana, Strain SAG 46.84" /LENGTH=160 /DNA_ID=CAMNT_0027101871 /DNA_START=282 /DNA_END=764 /DNA_ORIENTATION=+